MNTVLSEVLRELSITADRLAGLALERQELEMVMAYDRMKAEIDSKIKELAKDTK